LTEDFVKLREGFKPTKNEEDENQSQAHEGDQEYEAELKPANDNNINSNKGGRPKVDWNNVLEDNPVKEKYPPERSDNNENSSTENIAKGTGTQFDAVEENNDKSAPKIGAQTTELNDNHAYSTNNSCEGSTKSIHNDDSPLSWGEKFFHRRLS
jgi:hypothetical protein